MNSKEGTNVRPKQVLSGVRADLMCVESVRSVVSDDRNSSEYLLADTP